jgi:hypothetical protein
MTIVGMFVWVNFIIVLSTHIHEFGSDISIFNIQTFQFSIFNFEYSNIQIQTFQFLKFQILDASHRDFNLQL